MDAPFPRSQAEAAKYVRDEQERDRPYLAWANYTGLARLNVTVLGRGYNPLAKQDQKLYPDLAFFGRNGGPDAFGFKGPDKEANQINFLKSFAAENIKLYETSGIPPSPGMEEAVKRAYEMSKKFLEEIKIIETDKMYVAPAGVPSRRTAFGEADYTYGKTAVEGGRKRRKTSKRKHRKSKTAKRRARR
jgi:hypothetical protein